MYALTELLKFSDRPAHDSEGLARTAEPQNNYLEQTGPRVLGIFRECRSVAVKSIEGPDPHVCALRILYGEEDIMRWFHIREASIDPELRETFERYGTITMQVLVATNSTFFRHKGNLATVQQVEQPLLSWLTEQYDRAERKEAWSITMEAAITLLVLAELLISLITFYVKR